MFFKPQERSQIRSHLVRSDTSVLRINPIQDSGCAAILALSSGYLTAECIEACRRAVRRALKKVAKLRICARSYLPLTQKPSEVRMGKGKGKIKRHVYPVRQGKVIFEVSGVSAAKGKVALARIQSKIHVPTRIVSLVDRA